MIKNVKLLFPKVPEVYYLKLKKKNQIRCGLGANSGPNYVQCCEESKTGNIIKFFSYFTRGLSFKARSSGCKTT